MQRITKIKIDKNDRVFISYEFTRPEADPDEFTLNSLDKPLPGLHEALQALAEDVVDMCELAEADVERVMVKSVSFSYGGDDGVMGATISAQKTLRNSVCPLNLNTPHKIERFYSENGDEKQLLSHDCVDRLKTLIWEVNHYIAGNRAQGSLFGKEKAAA